MEINKLLFADKTARSLERYMKLEFLSFFLITLSFLKSPTYAQGDSEHRGAWMNYDTNYLANLDKLKAAHLNAIYFGIWGANNHTLQ